MPLIIIIQCIIGIPTCIDPYIYNNISKNNIFVFMAKSL